MPHAKAPTKRPAHGAAPHAVPGGSSQSRESDGRLEAKLDRLLLDRGVHPVEISEVANRTV
jgi:hypothetical protein